MKIVVAIIAAAVVSAGITYIAVPKQSSAEAPPSDSQLSKQNAALRKDLEAAKRAAKKAPTVVQVEKQVIVSGATLESPEVILDYLAKVDLSNVDQRNGNTDEHRVLVRQVIRQFEELTAMGRDALPAISTFLSRKVDKQFRENTSEIVSGNWSEGRIYLDPIFPPSLRIGLMNTVRHIGKRDAESTTAAENTLLGALGETGRAIEVAYIARALDDLAKDVHTDAYLAAARELLTEEIRQEGREVSFLNRQNRPLLLNLLRQHKDTSFVDTAKTQLIRTGTYKDREGKEHERTYIDGSVMGYLTGVLGKDAMPILRNVYDTPELDDRARSSIRQTAASYIGVSPDANIIINSRVTEGFKLLATVEGADAKQQKANRDRGLGTIRYYLGRMGDNRNITPETLQARRDFLGSIRAQTNDKEVLVWMDRTTQRLDAMADPEKAKKLRGFDPRRDPNQPEPQRRR